MLSSVLGANKPIGTPYLTFFLSMHVAAADVQLGNALL